MKKSTPTYDSVRSYYVGGRDEYDPNPVSDEQMYADFDRFISRVRAEAWDEGFQDGRRYDGEGDDGPHYVNPYSEETVDA